MLPPSMEMGGSHDSACLRSLSAWAMPRGRYHGCRGSLCSARIRARRTSFKPTTRPGEPRTGNPARPFGEPRAGLPWSRSPSIPRKVAHMDERQDQRHGYPLTIPDALLRSDAMRQACATRNFQEVFRLVNRRTGSSYAVMAAAVGKMTSSRVSDIIRGVRGIRGQEVIKRVADGFGIPGEMLGVPARPWESSPKCDDQADIPTYASDSETQNTPTGRDCSDTGGTDEMMRREFLRTTSVLSTMISVPWTQTGTNKTQDLATPRSVESCERMNSHLWQIFSLATSKRAVYPVVRDRLAEITSDLKRIGNREDHRRLCAATADLFQIAGEIFFDSNRYTDAAQ